MRLAAPDGSLSQSGELSTTSLPADGFAVAARRHADMSKGRAGMIRCLMLTVVLGLAGGWQRRLHGNPHEMEGERPQDAPNDGREEEVRLRGVDDGYLRGIRVLFSA